MYKQWNQNLKVRKVTKKTKKTKNKSNAVLKENEKMLHDLQIFVYLFYAYILLNITSK